MLKKTSKIILTAGPSITEREIAYVADATAHGWNHRHSEYIGKFEKAFMDYVGAGMAMVTSSCTGALHLALLGMGIGPGDEVIVPETTWIATASAVVYVGATPVFADIEPDTWVMDPKSVEKLITPKTKAIIPVHLYGHPVDMDPIVEMAARRGIGVLEDAAPSIGAEYKGRKTGSLGRAAAFSFQGAKAFVTGEGGMLVTSDEALMKRARFLGDHGRDPNNPLSSIEVGYKYKMSNIQAALGLAQIERAEDIVARKRQLYSWYSDRLSGMGDFALNVERPWARSIYWMSSLVLGDSIRMTRDEFMARLKERNIDTRPFFAPISSCPMFRSTRANNPVAYRIPLRGVNLPSGHERTEEEIDYICAHVLDILGLKPGRTRPEQPGGWLAFRDRTIEAVRDSKAQALAGTRDLPMTDAAGKPVGRLRPLGQPDLESRANIAMLSKWRDAAQKWFPSRFKVTDEGTRRWLEHGVLGTDDRLLFFVLDGGSRPVGHVGLFRFDYQGRSCEIDNIVRGVEGDPALRGIMTHACRAMMGWAFDTLGLETLYLRTVSDNARALRLYERLGFVEIQRSPLTRLELPGETRWIDMIGRPYAEAERYSVTMRLHRGQWKP